MNDKSNVNIFVHTFEKQINIEDLLVKNKFNKMIINSNKFIYLIQNGAKLYFREKYNEQMTYYEKLESWIKTI